MKEIFEAIEDNNFDCFIDLIKEFEGNIDQDFKYRLEKLSSLGLRIENIQETNFLENGRNGDMATTLLGFAIHLGRVNFIKHLVLEKNADVNHYDMFGYTPLLYLMRSDSNGYNKNTQDIATFLISRGADIYAQDKSSNQYQKSAYDISSYYLKKSYILRLFENSTYGSDADYQPENVAPIIMKHHQALQLNQTTINERRTCLIL